MASSFNMPCVRNNFFFLLTGVGKGCFNIFVGTLLMVNIDDIISEIMGVIAVASGLLFLFLAKVKHMTDEEL